MTDLLAALMKKHKISAASYTIIDDFKIVAGNTVSINADIKTNSLSLFQAASLSKCLTAYAVIELVIQGKIDLDEPINRQLKTWHIPSSEFSESVTVRHCLNMTSGLCYGELDAVFAGYTQQHPIPELRDILAGRMPATNAAIQSSHQPGEYYAYTGAGYMVVQQLLEEITSLPFADYMNQTILKYFNMRNSIFECPLSEKWRQHVVPGFDAQGRMNADGWDNIVTTASGGLWATSYDIANFILKITAAYRGLETPVLQSVVTAMFAAQENAIGGLGVVVEGEGSSFNIRKNGHNAGYHNELLLFPHTGQGIVVMTNAAHGMAFLQEVIRRIAAQYRWPAYNPHFDELRVNEGNLIHRRSLIR